MTNLSDAIRAVVDDVRKSWDDLTDGEAVDHARDTLRLPEEPPVAGAYPIEDDGTPLAAAYRQVLTADPDEIAAALAA